MLGTGQKEERLCYAINTYTIYVMWLTPVQVSENASLQYSLTIFRQSKARLHLSALSYWLSTWGIAIYNYYTCHTTLSEKRVLSRTFKGSSAQRSAGTFKGSRWNLLEIVLGGTLPEDP